PLDLGRNADGDGEVAVLSGKHIRGNIIDEAAIDQRLSVAANRSRKHGQVYAFENRMDGVSPIPNDRMSSHQINRNGETRDRQLLQLPVLNVVAKHLFELAAPVLVQQIPVTAAGKLTEDPGEFERRAELLDEIIAIQTRGVEDSCHRTNACADNHIGNDAVVLEGFEHT